MKYSQPELEIIELSTQNVVCTSDKFFDPDNPDNDSDMGDEIW